MSKTVLVLSLRENPLISQQWLRGFRRYARTAKWNVEMDACTFGRQQERRVKGMLQYFNPDGVVSACYEEVNPRIFVGIPHVLFDPPLDRIPQDETYVSHDSSHSAALAAGELFRLGKRHFAVVGAGNRYSWSRCRMAAFRSQVAAHGGTLDELELVKHWLDGIAIRKQIESWLKTLPRPCGVFAVNDNIAAAVISAAKRAGLRVPDELAVVGVDNDEGICGMSSPTITSIATDWEKGGFMAAESLDHLMRAPSGPVPAKTFGELGVIRRASTTLGESRADPRVAEASAYIREHACEGIGVDDVVRHMGCSRWFAMKKYLEATGRSIFDEIREARFASAMVLLAQRGVQIGVIADRCGWKSPAAFRTYFEKRLGMTMSAWRTQHLNS